MKNRLFGLAILAIALVLGMTVVGCDNGSTDDIVPQTVKYEGKDAVGNTYILTITEKAGKAAYAPAAGDSYVLIIKITGQPDKKSSGTITLISADGTFTLKPSVEGSGTFSIVISGEKISAVIGDIALEKGEVITPNFPSGNEPGEQEPGEQKPGEQEPGGQEPGEQKPGEQKPSGGGEILVSESTLAEKLAWLKENAASNTTYMVEVTADESFTASQELYYEGKSSITINLKGTGATRVISLVSGNGSLLAVGPGVTLELDNNITLRGHNNNEHQLVWVGGTLIMKNGSKITGNTNTSGWGGGVGIGVSDEQNLYGTFIMKGGEISGNTAPGAAGVGVWNTGTFIMEGGVISGNTATTYYGGGVFSSGTFRIINGTIYGSNESAPLKNTASTGAAIYVTSTAQYGTLSGNTWNSNGSLSTTSDTVKIKNGNIDNGSSGGDNDNVFTSIVAMAAWLSDKPANTATTPYTVKLNIAVLQNGSGNLADPTTFSDKYIDLDLSGSTFTSIWDNGSGYISSQYIIGITIPASVISIGNAALETMNLSSITFLGTITADNFKEMSFGDLRAKYLAGGIGTYMATPPWGQVWTKQSGGGEEGGPFTTIAAMAAWLSDKPANTAATPYTVKLNVSDLGSYPNDIGKVLDDNNTKYVSIDLSGSTSLTSIDANFGHYHDDIRNGLISIIIPSSVTSIGDDRFIYNTNLTSVTFQGTITSENLRSNAFLGDLENKYLAGGTGTYTTTTPATWDSVWEKQ